MPSLSHGTVSIAYRTDSPLIQFGVDELDAAISQSSHYDLNLQPATDADLYIIGGDADAATLDAAIPEDVTAEGFKIEIADDGSIYVWASDDAGAMYGTLELAERTRSAGEWGEIEESTINPAVEFRALKFNLPWSPYRYGEQTEIHFETCRDLEFWRAFLDMMARNRFNALTLWNLHPFPYMIKPHAYPEASPLSDRELDEWKSFWHELFRMAKERGIETYLLTWNIVVTEEFADIHGVERLNDTAEVIKTYTRESITQVLNEYEDLTGIGTTMSDWMGAMTPREKQQWLKETFVDGIAAADRPATFLDRSVRTNSIDEMRRVIDEADDVDNVSKIWVPSKFNWSHGHSTTALEMTHDYRSGEVDDSLWNPEPTNYELVWTVRNEDFFVLRWGDPDFIRDHIQANHASKSYVGGYIIGSEGYIPAKDFSHRVHEHQTWQYAFEKQWLFYLLWGRLLYDPTTSDEVFEQAFETRYGPGLGERLLKGYKFGSRMPIELAAFHAGTWDYTLYPEGFLAPVVARGLDDGVSPFISIDELVDHQTLDSSYLSIPEYIEARDGGEEIDETRVTPIDLAERMERNGEQILGIVDSLNANVHRGTGALECELADLVTWGHLTLYFAKKLRAGVKYETYRVTGKRQKDDAVELLREAADHWERVSAVTDEHYHEIPYATDWKEGTTFSWKKYNDQVQRDIHIVQMSRPYDYKGA
ncbi:hypothetical protein [Haladaptatus sp. YSMS36]|uniref:hypothetical protein n=1 Tax=Haladaptatus sp. YSMS36 TaxID=3033384 RepID=UPI0023E8C6FC|nr:hypothetical protein [Haladaptatus sp. YSMS36]